MHDPDADLIQRAGKGEARAVELIVQRHAERLIRLSRRMLGDGAEAEDVAQEVFLRVWREAPNWRPGEAKLQTWMHRVALNLCYDRLRRRETPDAEAGLAVADPAPSPGDVWLEAQRAERVRSALARLPERQRAAIVLCHFEEVSNIEAASALGVSVDAVESLLARARRALKTMLADVAPDMGELGDVRRE